MRYVTQNSMAALLLAGAGVFGVAPAFAGPDEAHQDSFWTSQTTYANQPSAGQHYIQVDPRDAKAAEGVGASADASNPYFDHAAGTMSTHAGENVQAPVQGNGRYVAAYHQYMQMDPRDTKVDAGAAKNVDGDNVYFNHAQGTMSGN